MRTTLTFAALVATVASKAMVGTNIGGWQVLEPWITPSLFYRFLGNTKADGIGVDQYTFCEQLGPDWGNQVLRDHWDNWVTESDIAGLADRGVEIVRLPIGDWTLKPYGPYQGCTDGAADKVQWLLDTAEKYNIKVLLDVHCLKGSQNGFDNSGQALAFEWLDDNHFSHWEIESANWIGDWNVNTYSYDNINQEHIDWALDNVSKLLDRWGSHPALYALEPVNEPWWNTPRDTLVKFYQDARAMIQEKAPEVTFVFHNAFDYSTSWNSMFADDDIDKVVMDTHFYQAWNADMGSAEAYCNDYEYGLGAARDIKYDVWVGEWSLALDTCATWLGGFNDNNSDIVNECEYVECPYTYMPESTGTDFDRTAAELGPFGSNHRSTILNGKCPRDSTRYDEAASALVGQCALKAFDDLVEGQFLWTFHNELEDRWSYVNAYDKGWIKPTAETFLQ